jgi:hypothetical protein
MRQDDAEPVIKRICICRSDLNIDFLHFLKDQFSLEIICLAGEVQSHIPSQILVRGHLARLDTSEVFELDHGLEVELGYANLESLLLDIREDCVREYRIFPEVQTEEDLS